MTVPQQPHKPEMKPTASVCWGAVAAWRFFLAWIVLTGHLLWFENDSLRWTRMFDAFGGKAAVVGFLLVSGYSIAASLERNESGFYRRRFLRIYPLYFVAIAFAVALDIALAGHIALPHRTLETFGWISSLGNFLMVQTFLVRPIPFDGPVWSLSIEVFFYALAPFFARLPRKYLYGLVALSMICFSLPRHDDWGIAYFAMSRFNALNYLWCWVLGFLLWSEREAVLNLLLLAGGAVVWFGSATPEPFAIVTYGLSGLLLISARRLTLPQRLSAAGDYLGDISYPLYLFHLPTFILVYAFFGIRHPIGLVLCSLIASVLSLHVIDKYIKSKYIKPWLFPKKVNSSQIVNSSIMPSKSPHRR